MSKRVRFSLNWASLTRGPYVNCHRIGIDHCRRGEVPARGSLVIEERWLPVVGAEHNYEVSDRGRVRSIDHMIYMAWRGTHVNKKMKGKLLKPNRGRRDRYLQVGICVKGKIIQRMVHCLVLEAFVCPRPEGLECAHLDGTRTNNCLRNLEWVTRVENNSHQDLHGTRVIGESHGMARLCNEDILRIREARLFGASMADLAAMLGVTIQNIWHIVHRKTWKLV